MAAKATVAQRDFSAGELDISIKRNDEHPAMKIGARQMSNWRALNSHAIANRPGRKVLYKESGRVDRVLLSTGHVFDMAFGNGTFAVYDSNGTQLYGTTGLAWTVTTAKSVVWAVYGLSVYITFPGQIPKVLIWDGASTFALNDYAEISNGGQKRTPFYRFAAKGITLTPSGASGNITIAFSAGVLVAGMVGTRIRYQGKQMTITAVSDSQNANATVNETLQSAAQRLAVSANVFVVGDTVYGYTTIVGTPTGAIGRVTATAAGTIDVVLLETQTFDGAGVVRKAGTYATLTSVTNLALAASAVWDQEVMNAYQGWPQSVFVDQVRLGFCDFPTLPSAVLWSAENQFDDLYPDAYAIDGLATDAIFEIAPNKSRVYYVVPGPESNEFVFCDNRVYWIPISTTTPLKPGSIAFNQISTDGSAQVEPRAVEESIIYLNAGSIRVKAVIATGSYTRPYEAGDLSELHMHLFSSPIAIAVPQADGTFPERYIYVLNGDGTIAVGKYLIKSGVVAAIPSWLPWSGNGTVKWISARAADLLFTTSYAPNGIAAVSVVEILDEARYLDGSQKYTTQPTGLPIPGGKGPLWWLAGGSVDLMDGVNGRRMMGTYIVDANGFLVPQGNAGEDLTSANLIVGQAWTAIFEPFVPAVETKEDIGQRMWPRRILRVQTYVQNSTGFAMARLYSGESGANLPTNGTVMKLRRIPAWNIDEDPTQEPPLREQSYLDRPIGRSHDPRWCILKDTPGPLTILENFMEITV